MYILVYNINTEVKANTILHLLHFCVFFPVVTIPRGGIIFINFFSILKNPDILHRNDDISRNSGVDTNYFLIRSEIKICKKSEKKHKFCELHDGVFHSSMRCFILTLCK